MRLSMKEAKALGIDLPKKSGRGKAIKLNGKARATDSKAAADVLMAKMCKAHGVSAPVGEYPFAKEIGRKWKFDWLFDGWLALEVQGGLFTNGRHSRGPDLLDEHEKIMEAASLGYTVVFCTPDDLTTGAVFPKLKRILEGCQHGD